MSYVVGAYAVTILTLLVYAGKLAAEARSLREEISREREEISRARPNGG